MSPVPPPDLLPPDLPPETPANPGVSSYPPKISSNGSIRASQAAAQVPIKDGPELIKTTQISQSTTHGIHRPADGDIVLGTDAAKDKSQSWCQRGRPAPIGRVIPGDLWKMVRVEGLEPPRLAAPEPKSSEFPLFSTPRQALFYKTGHEQRKKL
ncbi:MULTISPECIES: hypothetical protein [unclassified Phaeobacter]|uniref:hypothetical protein n=1 Tax=unclassified Phaeobacter TaxID=2621772 RepID=UPI003A8717FE